MTTNTNTIEKSRTYYLVINALFIALTLVATWLINIRLPFMGSGGLIHLGNVPLFVAAMLFGRKTGAIAGAFGMGLFDLMSGWTAWAPFTFIIVGCMGYVVGLLADDSLDAGIDDHLGTDVARSHFLIDSSAVKRNAFSSSLADGVLFGMDGADAVA